MKKYSIIVIAGLLSIIVILTIVKIMQNTTRQARDHDYRAVEGPHLFIDKDFVISKTLKIANGVGSIDTALFDLTSPVLKPITLDVPKTRDTLDIEWDIIAEPGPWEFDLSSDIFIISDLEGNFVALKNLLQKNLVMNAQFEWIFGQGDLVILGDVFDRGMEVTECLWLIYHLEKEAARHGGRVHLVLGNHETMVMMGDYRYAMPKYQKIAQIFDIPYNSFFSKNTVLGRWLRTKNAVIKIGPYLLSHGGVSPAMANQTDLNTINDVIRKMLDTPLREDWATNHLAIVGSDGPLWFRGFFDGSVTELEVEQILNQFKVEKLIVGHTVVDGVSALYEGRIIAVDVTRHRGDEFSALLIDGDYLYKVDESGQKELL